jgi:hypothetical protein
MRPATISARANEWKDLRTKTTVVVYEAKPTIHSIAPKSKPAAMRYKPMAECLPDVFGGRTIRANVRKKTMN